MQLLYWSRLILGRSECEDHGLFPCDDDLVVASDYPDYPDYPDRCVY